MRRSGITSGWGRLLGGALTVAALSLAATPALAADAPKLNVGGVEGDASGGGSIKGVVKFNGKQAARKAIPAAANDEKCAAAHKSEPLREEVFVFGDNDTLQNVFVYVSKGLEGKTFSPPATKAVLDQHGCQYIPHVQGVVKGQEMDIKNSDPFNHNVNAKPQQNTGSNINSVPNSVETRKFTKAEMAIPVKCDVHPWMNAYIHVMEHPFFAVTQQDGTFEINGLPPGDYEVAVWHEFSKFSPDKASVPVKVEAGKAAEVTFTYAPPAPKAK